MVFHADAGRAASRASSLSPRWRSGEPADAAAGELVEPMWWIRARRAHLTGISVPADCHDDSVRVDG
jgi:hypothetical protein